MSHWAATYIGLPHARGAAGPDAYDCLSFAVHVQRVHFGVDMNLRSMIAPDWRDPSACQAQYDEAADERERWVPTEHPAEGGLVLMSIRRVPVHIGVWIKANGTEGVLHCAERAGVVFQTLPSLRRRGWGGFKFYTRIC